MIEKNYIVAGVGVVAVVATGLGLGIPLGNALGTVDKQGQTIKSQDSKITSQSVAIDKLERGVDQAVVDGAYEACYRGYAMALLAMDYTSDLALSVAEEKCDDELAEKGLTGFVQSFSPTFSIDLGVVS